MKPDTDFRWKALGIAVPVIEYKFHPTRKWRFDYAWPYQWLGRNKVALEIEGGSWTQGRHTRGKGFIEDMKKYNEAARLGWLVFRCTPQQYNSGEAHLLMKEVLK